MPFEIAKTSILLICNSLSTFKTMFKCPLPPSMIIKSGNPDDFFPEISFNYFLHH